MIPEEIFFVIYCPVIPHRQVWMDGILFYVLRSLYLKNNNTKSNRVKPILYVEICIEQSYGLCGRGRGWEDLGEWH